MLPVSDKVEGRILCVADTRKNLTSQAVMSRGTMTRDFARKNDGIKLKKQIKTLRNKHKIIFVLCNNFKFIYNK